MNWYKIAQKSTVWHISNEKFKAFDPYMTAQGIIWFSKDKDDLLKDLHGASVNNQKPIYLYQCQLNIEKTAGREEYERYGIGELESMGYDSIDLEGDVAVLNPDIITIEKIERVTL